MELVSIIMPTYNCGRFIKESIDSVLAQTYENWELLIVDDCSTDETESIVRGYKDERIHYWRNAHNEGAALTRNRALREAKGKYIAFLDSDDVWLPEKLERQVAFMCTNHYAFTYTAFHRMDKPLRISGPKRINKCMMYAYCWPGCPTVMYNREQIGLVQISNLRRNNDYAMWLHIIHKTDCYLLDEDLFCYNKHTGSVSDANPFVLIRWHYILWRQEMQCSPLTAFIYTGLNIVCGIYKKLRYTHKMR